MDENFFTISEKNQNKNLYLQPTSTSILTQAPNFWQKDFRSKKKPFVFQSIFLLFQLLQTDGVEVLCQWSQKMQRILSVLRSMHYMHSVC